MTRYVIVAPIRGMPSFWDASKRPPGAELAKASNLDVILFATVPENGMLRLRNPVKIIDSVPAVEKQVAVPREYGEFMLAAKKSRTKVFLCEAALDGYCYIVRTYLEGENFEILADQHASEVYMTELDSPYETGTAVFWVKTIPGAIESVGWFPDAKGFAEEMGNGDGWDPEDT